MISWIPFLGRNGIANNVLLELGLIDEPPEWLLFSDFAVVLAFVHLYALFMVVPVFNTMMWIDKSLVEAARDAGASGFQILTNVLIPLSKPGLMIGSIRRRSYCSAGAKSRLRCRERFGVIECGC